MEIQFKNVCPEVFCDKEYKSDVWNADFSLCTDKRYELHAQSGKGKSSLIYFLMGLRADYFGDIFLNKKNLKELHTDEWVALRRRTFSCVFQDLQLIDHLTISENIALLPEFAKDQGLDQALEMLEGLNMADKWDSPIGTLSFGQKQRVALVRSLSKPFEFLICDEPFSHLDALNKSKCFALIEKRLDQEEAGWLLTSLDSECNSNLQTIQL